jgi:hypothetical protein
MRRIRFLMAVPLRWRTLRYTPREAAGGEPGTAPGREGAGSSIGRPAGSGQPGNLFSTASGDAA